MEMEKQSPLQIRRKKEVTLSVYPYRSAMSRDCDTPILVYRFDHGSAQHAQHYHAHCP